MDGAQAVQRTSMHVRSSKGHHSDLQAIAQKSGLIKSCCNYKTNVNNSFQTELFLKLTLSLECSTAVTISLAESMASKVADKKN